MQSGDGLALGVQLTADVLADAAAADLRVRTLCVRLTGNDAAPDAVFRMAAQRARIRPRGQARQLDVGNERALAIGAAADVQALAFLARFEHGAVRVVLAGRLATAVDADLVERAVRAAPALDALAF